MASGLWPLRRFAGLVKKYSGKYIVIKDQQVLGVYETDLEAISKTSENHEIGTFLVHKCESGEQNYTATFYSRVAFTA